MTKTVLLADDSLTIQRVVTLTFANEDVTITSVSDGDQAVESITRTRPDLVLADIAMPGRSGYQVAEFVRSQPELSSLPVLLLAGAFDHVDEAQVRTAGADGVLTKPFEPKALIGQVKQFLETGRREPAAVPHPVSELRTPVAEIGPPSTHAAGAVEPPIIDTTAAAAVDGATAFPDVAPPDAPREAVAVTTESAAAPSEPVPVPEAPAPIAPVSPGPTPVASSPVPPPFDLPAIPRTPSPDSYFEQIDQAFAALAKTPRPSLNLVPKPPVSAPPAGESRDEVVAAVVSPTLTPFVNALKEAEAPARTIPLFDAFSALLDAERAGVVDTSIRLTGVPAFPGVDLDALAKDVMHRVLAQMSDRVVRETVAGIVSSTAERLVREEIEQVKRNIT